MLLKKRILTIALMLATGFITLPATLNAGEISQPNVPKASKKADEKTLCVRPVEDMRKNHMDYILHQRDKTVHEGVRTEKDSLAKCIDCHIAPDEKGKYADFGEDQHFCSSCHNYASVQVDCFECHRDKPRNVDYKHSLIDKSTQNKYKRHHNGISSQSEPSKLNDETLDELSQLENQSGSVE